MKYRHNKILSFLLLLVMAFGLLQSFAGTAQADDVTTVTTSKDLVSALENGGSIKLGADIITNNRLAIVKDTQLDLNGYGILVSYDKYSTPVNVTGTDGGPIISFTLSDSNPNSVHYITLNADGRYTAVNTEPTDGAIEVKGGYLTSTSAESGGVSGGVHVGYWHHFNMTGGTILGNIGAEGIGVFLSSGAEFTMSGGTITRNSSPVYAGGVTVFGDAKFTMTGGTISGNTGQSAGGVYVMEDGTFSISGSPNISGNFQSANDTKSLSNVYIVTDKITVSDTLTDSAKIGVTMETPGVFTSGLSGKGSLSNFTTDNYSYIVTSNADGEAQLEPHDHNLSYSMSGDSCVVATCSATNCPLPDSKATLTISAPVTGDGKAVLTSNPEGFFGDLSSLSVKYQSKSGGNWVDQDEPPTTQGIHKASVTYTGGGNSYPLSVSYGMLCISYDNTAPHGTVDGPTGATVGAIIEPEFSPDIGYEVNTLTVTPDDPSVGTVKVRGNTGFIMPESLVTVSATFKMTDYEINIASMSNGTITASAATAHYQETATLTITPATGYELNTLSVVRADNGQSVTLTGNQSFVMPSSNVTVSATFKKTDYTVTYSSATNGSVSGSATANYQATLTPVITPAAGYELDTLSVVRADGTSVTVTGNKSFVMPPSNVTVSATFKMTDYTISTTITNGSITVPSTAHYNDEVKIVISPDKGYGISKITTSVTLTLVSKDTDTGVEVYKATMPLNGFSISVELKEMTIYTIFYKAAANTTSVYYRFYDGDRRFKMRSDAKAGEISCWAGQTKGTVGLTSFPIAFNVNNGGWGSLVDCKVVTDLSSMNTLAEGSAVLIAGDNNAFIAAFMWGAFDTDANGNPIMRDDLGRKYYFVSSSTSNISVPNPTKRGYDFEGWSYTDQNNSLKTVKAGSGNTTVSIKGNINSSTTFEAVWKPSIVKVFYDLNGGSWSNSNSESVSYKGKAKKPTDPTKENYAFDRWIVMYDAKAFTGGTERVLTNRSAFDFDNTYIIENITLRANWKHVHTYASIELSKLNDIIPGALEQEDIDEYGPYMHINLCSLHDNFHYEAHKYDKRGICVCGAEDPNNTEVTLEISYGNRDDSKPFTKTYKRTSPVSLTPAIIGTDKFIKWEYRPLGGTEWKDLSTSPMVTFGINASVRINAVYEKLSKPQVTLKAEHYKDDGLLFMLNYVLPSNCTAKNATVMFGDNYMMVYREPVRELVPSPEPEEDALSGFCKLTRKVTGFVSNIACEVADFGMDMVGIKDERLRNMVHFGINAIGDPEDAVGALVNLGLEATGLDDTIIGDVVSFGMAVATGDVVGGLDSAIGIASTVSDQMNKVAESKEDYVMNYKGREDNFLDRGAGAKTIMFLKMFEGEAITLPGSNYAKSSTAKKEDLGRLFGCAYAVYTGIKDVVNGNRYFYVMGWVDYTEQGSDAVKMALVGPIAVTYNGTSTPVTTSDVTILQ